MTRPKIREKPSPRSESSGNAAQHSGAATAPTSSSARYQTSAARTEPVGGGSDDAADSAAARRSGRTGSDTRRSARGHLSQSCIVGGVEGIEAKRSLFAAAGENRFVLRKSS